MVIESTTSLTNRMQALLLSKGFEVDTFKEWEKALEALKNAPYAMVISSYMMPRMKGDEILKNANDIAPDTQRLLIADARELETLVSAINQACIHSCLTLPFNDEDLQSQVNHCCRQYEANLKQKNLKRITQRQNRQLFQIASNFKKKDRLYAEQLEQKKKEIRILESRIRSAGGYAEPEKPVVLEDILARRGISLSPGNLGEQFILMKDQIKQIMETAALNSDITIKPVSYHEMFARAASANLYKGVAKKILPLVNVLIKENKVPDAKSYSQAETIILDDHFELTLAEDNMKAFINAKAMDTHKLNTTHVRQFLEKNKIIYGVKDEDEITSWLCSTSMDDPSFIIARGKKEKESKDAQIKYHFSTDFLHAGKVNKDGSINFQDRGEIPYVEEGAFLAAKKFSEQGTPGIDVFGKEILVDEPEDLTFFPGSGTRMSEDGLRIYASTAGQPHLDAMGNVSVCPEYQVKGDIGFETGDVSFDGNVIVSGSVKQGFKIRCASLTAKEIQGAEIDIDGDLNVSRGIVDTELVKVKGSVQAKFVRNSKISAFGDLIIQKEIVDSRIYLSGACINKSGFIINSEISAKMGVDAVSIGNKSSKPSTLTVGVDEHVNLLIARIDSKLKINNNGITELQTELTALEKEDQNLHSVISRHAYVQDRSQIELKDITKKVADLKASGNMAALQKVAQAVKEIQIKAKEAEEKINSGFERQDEIALDISQKKGRIKELDSINQELLDEKKRLIEFSNRNEPLPEVKVARTIESGTKIFAANSSLNIYNASSRCRIREYSRSPDGAGGILFYEMKIGDY